MSEGHARRKDQIDRELEQGKEFIFQNLCETSAESCSIWSLILVSSLPHNASATSQHCLSRTKVPIYGWWRTYPDYIHTIALKMIKLWHIKSNQTLWLIWLLKHLERQLNVVAMCITVKTQMVLGPSNLRSLKLLSFFSSLSESPILTSYFNSGLPYGNCYFYQITHCWVARMKRNISTEI